MNATIKHGAVEDGVARGGGEGGGGQVENGAEGE